MRSFRKILRGLVFGHVFIFCSTVARADGLTDLKTALTRLQGQTPVKAVVEVSRRTSQGAENEQEESLSKAMVSIEVGARGLQMLYGKDLMARAEAEESAKEKDAKAKTPTLSALRDIGANELRPMLAAASTLAHWVDKFVFKSEVAQTYSGKPARLLSFNIPMESIPERDRKFVKKYEGVLEIWIAADGTPLASHRKETVTGRAYVVISFESKNDDRNVYGVVGDRLITIHKESKSSGSGGGDKNDTHITKTLAVQ